MYCILLEFTQVPGQEAEFLQTWKNLTEYIYRNYGSKGSRMHRNESGKFIAYAQWPSKEIYDNVVGTGSLFILVSRRLPQKSRIPVAILFGAALVYLWAELSVGVFTASGNQDSCPTLPKS